MERGTPSGRGRVGDSCLASAADGVGLGAEAFVAGGVGVAEDAGEQAHGGVDDDGGGEFAAGEDVVADGELAVAEELVDALVDAFVAAADEDDALERGELRAMAWVKGLPWAESRMTVSR